MKSVLSFRQIVQLFLPVLFPSWRFFETIGASPRIEVNLRGTWTPTSALPTKISTFGLIWSLFWNPQRNEALYLTALAERALAEPGGPAPELLRNRIAQRYGPLPFRIWLETGAGRELAFEHKP